MADERRVWALCIAFRLLNALLVRTYFNPDEHWQALEVAHRIAFGYGHLTWEWHTGIRSYLHPLIFAALYKLMAAFRVDTPWLMVRAPRLFQALFAAANDVYLWKLARRMFDLQVAKWTLFSQFFNWFTFFCMVRTLSNSLETTLTTMALFYWSSHLELALSLAWFSCAIRPTSAIIWLFVGGYHLLKCQNKMKYVFRQVLPIGFAVFCFSCLTDRWMYGRWILVPLKFLQFNLLSGGGDFYGTHPWHWYFSQGFPAMAFTQLPLALLGIWWSKQWVFAGLIGWILLLYSFLGHKEFRFVLPALPLAMLFAGYSLASLRRSRPKKPKSKSKNSPQGWTPRFTLIVFGLLLSNIPAALYTSLVHQRGSEAVMEYLGREAAEGRVKSILFLTQCHATPFYSSLHEDLPMRFLDCSPSDDKDYKDEASRFFEDPQRMLSLMYGDHTTTLPSHIVIFDSLLPQVQKFMDSHSYNLTKDVFHAHFPVDRELQRSLLVFSLKF